MPAIRIAAGAILPRSLIDSLSAEDFFVFVGRCRRRGLRIEDRTDWYELVSVA